MDSYFLDKSCNIGKYRRLRHIFSDEKKCLIVPLDDSLISGPVKGLKHLDDKIKQIIYKNHIVQLTHNQLFVIHTLYNKSKDDDVMQKIKNVYKTHGSLRKMKSDINKAFLRAGVYDFLDSSGQKDNYRLDITTAYKIEKHK